MCPGGAAIVYKSYKSGRVGDGRDKIGADIDGWGDEDRLHPGGGAGGDRSSNVFGGHVFTVT